MNSRYNVSGMADSIVKDTSDGCYSNRLRQSQCSLQYSPNVQGHKLSLFIWLTMTIWRDISSQSIMVGVQKRTFKQKKGRKLEALSQNHPHFLLFQYSLKSCLFQIVDKDKTAGKMHLIINRIIHTSRWITMCL